MVLNKFNGLFHKVKTLEEKVDKASENKIERTGTNPVKDYSKIIPLAADFSVFELEQELCNDGIDNLVSFLGVIGGINEQDCIVRILQRLLTNETAENYSWSGSKGKRMFKNLYLAQATFCAAKIHYPNLTEKSAESIIGNWLRYAKQRRLRQEEKAKKRIEKDGRNIFFPNIVQTQLRMSI